MKYRTTLVLAALVCASTMSRATEFSASLEWSQRVDLGTPLSGIVEEVLVQPGQSVKRDAVLLRLNPRIFEANVLEAKADLERLGEEAAEARRDLERAKELYARTVSSTTEFDLAKLRQARAEANFNAARARVERARRQLDESSPRAPFDALILARHAEPGMAVSQCQPAPLLGLARADEILARAELGATHAAALRPGAPASTRIAGRRIDGQIRAIRPGATGKYLVDVAIPRDPDLLAGMEASVILP
jgi:multidrug efflux system membrane fusion protein